MKIAPFIFYTVILLMLTTCKHTQYDVRGCGEFTTYEDVKDFGMFPVETYWVYENQLTLARDTFTVYENSLQYFEGDEIGFYTRMTRSYENAEWRFTYNTNHNVIPINSPCEIRRIWMNRVDFDSQGMVNSIQQSKLQFPVIEGNIYFSDCGTLGDDVRVERLWEQDILSYSNVSTFSVIGPAFSLNPCVGENYRYQFAQGIGLISWENLDSLDGKWQLIEFERAE